MELPFQSPIEVRWADLDALGHVNHATYLTYMEQVRCLWLKDAFGAEPNLSQLEGPILANVTCNYLKPLTFPAKITVGLGVSHIGRRSFTLEYEIWHGEINICSASTVVVWINYESGAAVPLQDDFLASLRKYSST